MIIKTIYRRQLFSLITLKRLPSNNNTSYKYLLPIKNSLINQLISTFNLNLTEIVPYRQKRKIGKNFNFHFTSIYIYLNMSKITLKDFIAYLEPVFDVELLDGSKLDGSYTTATQKIRAVCKVCNYDKPFESTAKNVKCKNSVCPVNINLNSKNKTDPVTLFKAGIPLMDKLPADDIKRFSRQQTTTTTTAPKTTSQTSNVNVADEDALAYIDDLELESDDADLSASNEQKVIVVDDEFYRNLRSLLQTSTTKVGFLDKLTKTYNLNADKVFNLKGDEKASLQLYANYKNKFEMMYHTPKRDNKEITNEYEVRRYYARKDKTDLNNPHLLSIVCKGRGKTSPGSSTAPHKFNIRPEVLPILEGLDDCVFCSNIIPPEDISKYQDEEALLVAPLKQALTKHAESATNNTDDYFVETRPTRMPGRIGISTSQKDKIDRAMEAEAIEKLHKKIGDNFDEVEYSRDITRIHRLERALKQNPTHTEELRKAADLFENKYGFDPREYK